MNEQSAAHPRRIGILLVDDQALRRMGLRLVLEATARINRAVPECRVSILTTFDLDQYAFAALHAGASGFRLEHAQPAALTAAIRSVATGDAVISARVTRRMLEVLGTVADGLSNAEIAQRFTPSEATVTTHVGRILAKLDLRDPVRAGVDAYESGPVTPG